MGGRIGSGGDDHDDESVSTVGTKGAVVTTTDDPLRIGGRKKRGRASSLARWVYYRG